MIDLRVLAAAVFCFGLCGGPLLAETSESRQALFQAMLQNPSDQDLMLRYARQAVKDRDFEVAAATLERLVDFNPASVEARLELAAAYFALGSNEAALYHLNVLSGSDALTPAQQDLVAQYSDQARKRDDPSSYSGFAEAGFTLRAQDGEVGPRAAFGFSHRYDPGYANGTVFVTRLRAHYLEFGAPSTSGQSSIGLNFGPVLRLANAEFGPVLRPYVAARSTKDKNPFNERDLLGVGLNFETPLSTNWSVFANLEGGKARYDAVTNDGDYLDGQLGLVWFPRPDTRLRASGIRREVEGVDSLLVDSDFTAYRIDVEKSLRPNFARQDWYLTGFVQTESEAFQFWTDDVERVGAGLQAYVTDDVYVYGSVQYYDQTSTLAGFDKSQSLISLTMGLEF